MGNQNVTAATKSLRITARQHDGSFILGKDKNRLVCIPKGDGNNVIVFGPTGSGKTAGPVMTNILNSRVPVLAIDPSNEIYDVCKDQMRMTRFCPSDLGAIDTSCQYDLFTGILELDKEGMKSYLYGLSEILIPDDVDTGSRKYFQGIMCLLLSINPSISFPEVIHEVMEHDYGYWREILKESRCNVAKNILSPFYEEGKGSLSPIYDSIRTAVAPYSTPVLNQLLADNGNCFDIDRFICGESICLQVPSYIKHGVYGRLVVAIIHSIITGLIHRSILSDGCSFPAFMVLDEFAFYPFPSWMMERMLLAPCLKPVTNLIVLQGYSQLETQYGKEKAAELTGCFDYKIIHGCFNPDDSMVYSDMCREENGARVFMPDDFRKLGKTEQIVISRDGKCRVCAIPYYFK